MVSAILTIQNETGLHTRPGAKFVKLAKTFASNITMKKGERAFNAKSLLTLMKVGVSQGDSVELICEGTDEDIALDSLKNFITSLEE